MKADREAREKQKREDAEAQKVATEAARLATIAAKRPQPPVPIPATFQSHNGPVASPHVPVATPAIPKAPTPVKLRTNSQHEFNGSIPQTPQSSGLSQNVSPVPSTPLQGSPGAIGTHGKNNQHPFLHQPQATSPIHSALKSPPGMQHGPFGGMPMGMGFQPGMPMMAAPGFERMHPTPIFPHQPPMSGPFRPGPNGMPMHPGMNMHQMPQGRGFPPPHGPPGFPNMPNGLGGIGGLFSPPKDGPPPSQSHSRQQSASYDKPFENLNPTPQAQPIARPAPIGRPSSVVHGHRREPGSSDVDDLSNHLGSSALLDDSDEQPIPGFNGRRSSALNSRPNFAPIPFAMEPSAFASPMNPYGHNTWGPPPPNPFGHSSLPGFGGGWGPVMNGSFGGVGAPPMARPPQPRSITVRVSICRACKVLAGATPDGFIDINLIKEKVDQFHSTDPVSETEILDICDTEGNTVNGGGTFDVRKDESGCFIRHNADNESPSGPQLGALGEVGSPVVGNSARMARLFAAGPPPGF